MALISMENMTVSLQHILAHSGLCFDSEICMTTVCLKTKKKEVQLGQLLQLKVCNVHSSGD